MLQEVKGAAGGVNRSPAVDRRRRAVVLGAAGAALAQLGACGGGHDDMMRQGNAPPLIDAGAASGSPPPLPIIALDQGLDDGSGGRSFSLIAQRGSAQLLGGVSSNTLGYNGALLGPALRLRTGQQTTIRVRNNIGEVTTVHWHGLVVPAGVDGGPHQAIAPGATWEAGFTVANPASTCWYHPHLHGATGRQVASGLAGLLIIDDPAVPPSVLPATWGVDDLALVLQDKRFTASGQIDYALTANEQLIGYMGDRLLVNGAYGPVWQAPQQWLRLRLLNGCNARTLSLRLDSPLPMLQVANEGGLLGAPVARTSIALAPGERAEVLVDFSAVAIGQAVRLYAATVGGGVGFGMGMGAGSAAAEVTAMTLRVSLPRQASAIASAPASLPAAPAIVAGAGATLRSFELDGAMMGGPFTINGRSFDINRIDFAVPANKVEVWRFFNATAMAHPMHVHGVRMSLLARDGAVPAVHERGLRDTFIVDSMRSVTVAVQTPAVPSSTPLMLHCHILEHEDAGMMAQFISV
jgi:FtsP/CotA-like multicopper oxidase with cupredoxin domain